MGAPSTTSLTTVIVPTWKRASELDRCLEALSRQELPPKEILVVWRTVDEPAGEVIARWIPRISLTPLEIRTPGVVAAMNLALERASGDFIALTDDDAAPHPDWIARIQETFVANDDVVAFGGRDRVHVHGGVLPPTTENVGTFSWYGHARGMHHEGKGALRETRVLKGVNCSFRRSALDGLRFDTRLRGNGAQVHWELAFFLELGHKGRILYDPSLLVEHFPAQRHDKDQRDEFNPDAMEDAAYNETMVVLRHLSPASRIAFVIWAFSIGHTAHPGLFQALRHSVLRTRPWIWRTLLATWKGRVLATTAFASHRKE